MSAESTMAAEQRSCRSLRQRHCFSGRTSQARSRRAYTILELVLVLAIMAVVLMAVAPSLSGFAAGRRTEETAARFLALTNWARSQAISDGIPYEMVIDDKAGKWRLRVLDGTPEQQVNGAFGKEYTALDDVTVESDVSVLDGEQVIHFDPSGRSSVGTVRFIDSQTTIAVTCDAPLERFRIVPEGQGRP